MLTLSVLMIPLAAAQPRSIVPRIGILNSGTLAESHHLLAAFRHGLREHGWIEGQNLLVEERWAEVQPERLPDLVAELIRLKVEILFTPGSPATRAAQTATPTIPIVALMGDPVGAGFVASLARPGGNITGISAMTESNQKFLELLKEVVPTASRVAVLWNPADASNRAMWRETQGAATALGVTLQSLEARSTAEVLQVIAGMTRDGVDALLVIPGYLTREHCKQIVAMAAQQQLPAMYGFREFVEVGGLMSYATSLADLYRRAATHVDKILKGANPAELPVEHPTKFELVLNLKTAKALGLTIPPRCSSWPMRCSSRRARPMGAGVHDARAWPNKRLQATADSFRSSVAPAIGGA
jgi:putative ABC transport system substrate-binding protein